MLALVNLTRSQNRLTIMLVALIVIAGLWSIVHFSTVPQYGDTVEYYNLAQSLAVDSWRTLAYPALLRLVDQPYLIYILQISVTFIASLYFFVALSTLICPVKLPGKSLLFLAICLTAMPIITHFNFSILTDSLANSLLIISLSAIARIVFINEVEYPTTFIAIISVATSIFIRQERVIMYFALLFIYVALLLLWKQRGKKVLLLIILLIITLISGEINKSASVENPLRPKLNITASLFERISRTSLAENLHLMPPEIQKRVPIDFALEWAADAGYTLAVWQALDDEDGKVAMKEGIITTLRCCSSVVFFEIFGDFIEYILAPASYTRETIWEGVDPTRWTNTRFTMYHFTLSVIFIYYSFLVLIALFWVSFRNIYLVLSAKKVFWYWVINVLLISGMFSMRSSIDFHIRYALPIYYIEIGIAMYIALVVISSKKSNIAKYAS